MKLSRISSVGIFLAGLATPALADWRGISVPGSPQDVEIADAGYFAVASNIGAAGDGGFAILDFADAGNAIFLGAIGGLIGDPVASAFIDGAGCLSGYRKLSGLNLGCATNPIAVGGGNFLERVRHTSTGFAYASNSGGASPPTFYFQPTPTDAWAGLAAPTFGSTPGLSALHIGGSDFGLFGRGFPSSPFFLVDGGSPSLITDTRITTVNATALFSGGGLPRALLGGPGGLDLTEPTAINPVPVLVVNDISGVAFTAATGPRGEGFGIAIAPTGDAGNLVVFSAIPDPTALAQTWIPNTAMASLPTAQLTDVACWGATFCVLWGNATGPAVNVVTYHNQNAPLITSSGLAPILEGQPALLGVTVVDGDGDAVFVSWSVDAGSPLTLLNASPTGESIVVDAGFLGCQWSAVVPVGVHVTDGLHAIQAELSLEIDRPLAALGDAGFSLNGQYDPIASVVVGDAGIDACFARSDLIAGLTLFRSDGGAEGTASVSVPSQWGFSVPRTCQATSYSVVGQLTVDGGTYATASFSFDATPLSAGFDHLSTGTLQAVCGQPARADITVELDAGNCPTESFAWTAVPGPVTFQIQPQVGPSVSISTADASFDSLIGQIVSVQLSIDAGAGQSQVVNLSLPIVPSAPFIMVEHRQDRVVVGDEELLGIEVLLTNTSACAVTQTDYQESLRTLSYVEGTARVEGQPAAANVVPAADGRTLLIFSALDFDAGATRHLSYSVRPPLLGTVSAFGEATLRGVALSDGGTFSRGTSVSCGCSSAQSMLGGIGIALIALARSLQRRRAKTQS